MSILKTILFVCTGNTCRSPMAEGFFNSAAASDEFLRGEYKAASAGLCALDGQPASENAVCVMKTNWGIDISAHKASSLTQQKIKDAYLILTMTKNQKNELIYRFPEERNKVFTLKEFAFSERPNNSDKSSCKNYKGDYCGFLMDILDPYGLSSAEYYQCALDIREAVDKLLNILRKEKKMGKIAIGCDHAGYQLKCEIINYFNQNGIEYVDFGAASSDVSVDYPDFAVAVSKAVINKECEKGIVICGTGIGISISANKIPGIRAALCTDTYMARMSREHNDANILALGARVIGKGLAIDIVDVWLKTDFSGEIHKKRIEKRQHYNKRRLCRNKRHFIRAERKHYF